MTRGIDTEMFTLARRERAGSPFTIGFVGRLTPEKNVRFLAEMARGVLAAGAPPFQLSIAEDRSEAAWRRAQLRNAAMPGVCAAKRWRAPMRRISSPSPRKPARSATWCWKRWPAACRQW
ncbi:MAG: hypothetical protein ACLQU1_03255 [Bryobacteraceae bacterium]